MSTSAEFDELIALLVQNGTQFEIPEHLLAVMNRVDVAAPLALQDAVLEITFDPESAKFITVINQDLFVVTEDGDMILYEEYIAKLETGELMFIMTPQGEEMDAVSLFELETFSSDIANELSQIATAAGEEAELSSDVVSVQFQMFENEEISNDLEDSGTLGNSDFGIENLFRFDRFNSDPNDRESDGNGSSGGGAPEAGVEATIVQGVSQVLNAGGAQDFPEGTGLQGAVYNTGSSLSRLNQIDTLIDGGAPDGTFTGTEISYRGGSTIEQFLGDDGAAGSGALSASATTFAVQLKGFVYLDAGTHTFDVATDDGFRLKVGDDTVTQFDGNRGTRTSSGDIEITEPGLYPIDIVYWENGGGQTLDVALNGQTLGGEIVYPELPEGAVLQPNGHYTMPDPSAEVLLDVSAELTDAASDASVLSVRLEGIPADVEVSAGIRQPDGSIELSPSDLGTLTLSMDEGGPDFDVTIVATRSVNGAEVEEVTSVATIDVPEIDDTASAPTLDVSLGAPTLLEFDESNADVAGSGLNGEIYDSAGRLSKLNQIDAMIDGNAADASFTATEVNYSGGSTIGAFLGGDGASLTAESGTTAHTFAVKLTGYIKLDAGSHTFDVRSDDGFRLKINGDVVTQFDGNRGARSSVNSFEADRDGLYEVELVYWENGGGQVLDVELDGVVLGGDILFGELPAGYLTGNDGIAEAAASILQYPLDITALTSDLDGSETVSVTVSGLPDGAGLSAGDLNDDGSVTLTSDQLDGLVLTVPGDAADFDLEVIATSTESLGGDTATAAQTISIDVPEAAAVASDDSDVLDFSDGSAIAGIGGVLDAGDGDDVIKLDENLDNASGISIIDGGQGNDTVQGTSGNDTYDFSSGLQLRNVEAVRGGEGDDVFTGGISDDNFFGDAGNDIFSGGGGADRLSGGDGLDQLTGGAGADVFVIEGDGLDTITDFSAAQGDALDVSSLIDVDGVDDIDAYLRIEETDDGNTTVKVNASGSGEESDFTDVAVLEGVTGLSVNDLVGSPENTGGEAV